MSPLPRVAIVGRINVGKSTLFNRLTGERQALVSPLPGTTRDRREAEVWWRGCLFLLSDTGGVETPVTPDRIPDQPRPRPRPEMKHDLVSRISAQTERALREAELVLFVTSALDGIMPQDRVWARRLRGRVPALLVVNKVDNAAREANLQEFYALGLGAPQPVSAVNGRGTGDLLDAVVARLKPGHGRSVAPAHPPLTLAILGQPNSGKSTLANAIFRDERMITSPIPHTTREPIGTLFTYREHPLLLIDTAGIRRQAHVAEGVEAHGVAASLRTIDRADVVLLVIDVTRAVSRQDQRLARYVADHDKGLVIILNKWDLVADKRTETMSKAERALRQQLPGCEWAPLVFVSALRRQRIEQVLEAALGATDAGAIALDETTLRQFLRKVVKQHPPTKRGGVRHPTIISFKQIAQKPPRFEVIARGELHPAYLKFLAKRLREQFGFTGAPLRVTLKAKRPRPQK